jgi:hypothetical protein
MNWLIRDIIEISERIKGPEPKRDAKDIGVN